MRILFSVLTVILFCAQSFAQNECTSAVEVDASPNYCEDIDFDDASFESFNTSCLAVDTLDNMWYSFVANGPEIDIIANHETSQDVHISLIRFTGLDCDAIKYKEVACGVNTLYLSDSLMVGELYHVIINVEEDQGGVVEFCITNPDITPPPANDEPCGAVVIIPDSTCVTGTTVYAEPDTEMFQCSPSFTNEVWYEFTLSEGLFFGAEIFLENISATGDFRVILVEFVQNDCANGFVLKQQYCGPANGLVFDYVSLTAGSKYFVSVATAPETEGEFQLCIKEMEALAQTDPCNALEVIPNDACLSFDTYYSLFEYDLPECDFSNQKIWYKFYTGTELNDISVALDKLGDQENVFLGLGYFQGNFCENQFHWVETYCGDVADASFSSDNLLPYQVYHIVVGTNFGFTGEFDLCINGDYNSPYTNGSPCTAYNIESFTGCVGGSSAYGSVSDQDTICYGISPIATTWYKVDLANYTNAIDVEFAELSDIPVHKVQVGYFEGGCLDSFQIVNDFCGLQNSSTTSYTFPDSVRFAYIAVNLPTDQYYNYSICVNPLDLDLSCNSNDFCQEATELGSLTAEAPLCFNACTFGATQENTTEHFSSLYATTWFQFTTDESTESIEIVLSDATSLGYFIGLLDGEQCEYDEFDRSQYVQMTDFSPLRFELKPETSYKLAVVAVDQQGGAVDICIQSKMTNICQVDDRLYVTNTSLGSPFTGPFRENEIVSFCYEVTAFDAVDEGSCQWLQGIVPNFGSGWSPTSFDVDGKPLNATNIEPLADDVAWGWREDVHSRVDNFYRRLSTDANTTTQICHVNQQDCNGDMLLQGDQLPAGWYAHNFSQGIMHPDSTYGDGLNCDSPNGPWEVCFELQVDAVTDDADLSISMHTFADGEIGFVGVSDTSCMEDMPESGKYYVECDSQPLDTFMQVAMCSGSSVTVDLPSDQYFFWFHINNDQISGEENGSGSALSVTLEHASQQIQTTRYLVKSYSASGCHLANYNISIDVYPTLDINREPEFTVCQDAVVTMDEIIDLQSQIIGGFVVEWESDLLEDLPNASWDGDTSMVIPYLVTSYAGCTFEDTVRIHVEDVIVTDYLESFVACRDEQVLFNNILDLDNLLADPFAVDWDYGELADITTADTSFESSRKIPFTITGQAGCQYSDSLDIIVPHVPINVLGKDQYCSIDTVSISAGYEFNQPHTKYWILSTNDTLFTSGFSRPASIFPAGENRLRFELFTKEGCPFYDFDTITVFDYPEFTFNQDSQYLGVCPYDSLALNIDVAPAYFDVNWNTPNGPSNEKSMFINTEGWYSVEAGFIDNQVSCMNQDSFYLEVYPAVETEFNFDPLVCAGDSSIVESENPNYNYTWSNGEFSSKQILAPGDYSVTVSNGPGCVNIFDIEIDEQAIPTPTFEYNSVICEGDSTWITASDMELQYVWSTDQDSIAILSFGGAYEVTFTDSEMCTDSAEFSVEVVEYPEVEYNYTLVQDSLFLSNSTENAEYCVWMLNDDVLDIDSDTMIILVEGDYVLSMSCYNGDCGDFESDSISVIITGLEAQSEYDWKIYPNPSSGQFSLQISADTKIDHLKIFDIYGKEVYSTEFNTIKTRQKVNSNLPTGIYFVKLTVAGHSTTKRIIIE